MTCRHRANSPLIHRVSRTLLRTLRLALSTTLPVGVPGSQRGRLEWLFTSFRASAAEPVSELDYRILFPRGASSLGREDQEQLQFSRTVSPKRRNIGLLIYSVDGQKLYCERDCNSRRPEGSFGIVQDSPKYVRIELGDPDTGPKKHDEREPSSEWMLWLFLPHGIARCAATCATSRPC
jgi:hypothetical protein